MPTINAHRTFEPPSMPSLPDFERRRSTASSLSHNTDSLGGLQSPPLRSRSSRPKSAKFSSYRLRSNSGLSLHTNEDILRQYTDYHPDGTPRAGLYSNGGGNESDSSGELPIPDLVGREMFDMVMADHAASGQLWKFAADRGVGQNVDYLMKIRDYIQSLEQVVIQLSTISTSYTSITATSPLGLPPPMSKALNTNIKHLTTSLIPSLENMFLESKAFIEQRIVREIFPDFVKQQLSQCTSLALSLDAEGDSPLNPYPGLKGSFCLSDPSRSGNPIVFASDEFEELTGYSRTEVLAHNCRFLQGPQTDRDRIANMRSAIWRNDECTELLLNFRKDGTPFWNLLFLCPLLDKTGKTKFFMGAQIDVSSSIHDTDDVLKVLSYGAMEEERATERCSSRWASEASHDEPEHDEAFGIKNNTLKSKKATSFFKSFKKANPPPPSPPLSPRRSSDRPRSSGPTMDKTYSTRSVIRRFSSQPEMLMSTYARYMILEHVPSYPKSLGAMPLDQEGKYPPKLCVSFYSKEMSEALDLGPATEAVIGKDIFDIMTEQATLPSVTKAFKLTVRDLVVRDGKSVSLDLALANHIPRRANTSRSPTSDSDGPHKKPAKLMSHWTPLKDSEGHVKYVVMIVSPI
ncbi:Phototropin-1 [Fusarium culmorum]|uniref:Phototropin-1 n=1 Tax=Fusarium culmorum TaxID=5516 RepID=A0A2T4GJZ1_FUSCU|nr:Phototropin-1 [Fusarium culmorum]